MTDAALSPSRPSVAANPWLVAAAVVIPTFMMEVLDTTIAVVALQTGDPAAARQLAWQALENLRH